MVSQSDREQRENPGMGENKMRSVTNTITRGNDNLVTERARARESNVLDAN
jgi:hypothetical protein